MLIEKLLGVAIIGVNPILWILIGMSFVSFGIIVERVLAFIYVKKHLQNLNRAELRILLEKRLGILATFGNNAPFIGLFGTVLGIINAFHSLSKEGNEFGVNVVMGGISEALIATATGLFVAIPSVIAYNYFVRKIKMILLEMEASEQ
jgi:biopolymer transport protein ExbB